MNPRPYTVSAQGDLARIIPRGWVTVRGPEDIPTFFEDHGLGPFDIDTFKLFEYPFSSVDAQIRAGKKTFTAYHSDVLSNCDRGMDKSMLLSDSDRCIGTHVWLRDDPNHPEKTARLTRSEWKRKEGRPRVQPLHIALNGITSKAPVHDLGSKADQTMVQKKRVEEDKSNRFVVPFVTDQIVDRLFNRPRDFIPLHLLRHIPRDAQLEFGYWMSERYCRLSSNRDEDRAAFRATVAEHVGHDSRLEWRIVPGTPASKAVFDWRATTATTDCLKQCAGAAGAAQETECITALDATNSDAELASQASLVNAITAANATLIDAIVSASSANTATIAAAVASVAAAVKNSNGQQNGAVLPKDPPELEHLSEIVKMPPPISEHPAICDFCEKRIMGVRTSCRDCPDFDTCEDCRPRLEKEHPTAHRFFSTLDPEAFVAAKDPSAISVYHKGVVCDGCRIIIKGSRHVCLGCRDFDFCANCHLGNAEKHQSEHGVHHLFVQLLRPMDPQALKSALSSSKRVPRPQGPLHFSCDACNEMIHSHRFNNKKANPKYDLCAKCYREHLSVLADVDGYTAVSTDAGVEFPLDGPRLTAAFRSDCDFANASIGSQSVKSPEKGRSEREEAALRELSEKRLDSIETSSASATSTSTILPLPSALTNSEQRLNSKVTIELLSDRAPLLPAVPFEQKRALAARIACSSDESIRKISAVLHDVIALEASQSILDLDKLTVMQYETITSILDEAPTALMPSAAVDDEKSAEEATSSDVQASPTTESPDDDRLALAAEFVADVTIADGATVAPGSAFDKIWRVRNTGTEDWPSDVSVTMLGGERLGQRSGVTIAVAKGAAVKPGETFDVVVPCLRAPDAPGRYQTFYRLETRDRSGSQDALRFGQQLWIDINVVGEAEAMETSTESGGQSDLGGSSFFAAPHAPSISSSTPFEPRAPTSVCGTTLTDSRQPSALSSPQSEASDPFEMADAISESGPSDSDGYEIVYESTDGRASPDA